MEILPGALLQTIDSPADLKKLSRDKLHQLCDELRQYIIDVVSVHGGHFGRAGRVGAALLVPYRRELSRRALSRALRCCLPLPVPDRSS